MLIVKQSSLVSVATCTNGSLRSVPITSEGMSDVSTWKKSCGQDLGVPVAVSVPKELVRGCGGFNRRSPIGGVAKGMPLKESTPSSVEPMTVPCCMAADGADALSSNGAASASADSTSRAFTYRYIVRNAPKGKQGFETYQNLPGA